MQECDTCAQDSGFLRLNERPDYEKGPSKLRIVDLFCGCGGLTLGLAEAARRAGLAIEIPLAVDDNAIALKVYGHNFPGASTDESAVEELFDGELGSPLTDGERAIRNRVGRVDVLAGGPPCQGHSNLNNHTRRRDPRNALYDRMARAAEVLRPRLVLIENVPAVVKDAAGVVDVAEATLREADYLVAHRTLNLADLGVPQRRRRHLLLASPTEASLYPADVLANLGARCAAHPTRSVRWAIEDLEDFDGSVNPFERASVPSADNVARIRWLFDHDDHNLPNDQRPECHQNDQHTYHSMYGRLRWDEPAQTVTTGFGSMGQGRYVHPSRQRTITPHEAARLQSFPDFFEFAVASGRGAWAQMIGNAVPPLISFTIGEIAIPHLSAELKAAA